VRRIKQNLDPSFLKEQWITNHEYGKITVAGKAIYVGES
jgi:hypothetical protein